MSGFDQKKIEIAVRMILEAIGEDPDREGLLDTPARVGRMYSEVFSGLHQDPREQLKTIFNEDHNEVVLVKDITFYSMCEHHLVPFYGHAHVAYIPQGARITGLSKLARLVESTARRPQLQERLTSTIANALVDRLDPAGVAVMIEAEHMCMAMRGVNKPGTKTLTTAVRGILATDTNKRKEVFDLMHNS
ncbi:MAG: GTP cyclohydrolase I FolE [Acidibacillus sp.]|uniref:GTP cyclohydrolase 1 n=1 Tax=Sulfoacidibacillus ferrooxidans TaxID=2005001 RepID=A0A9X1V9U1_9BACL|nr:GTP cyclohydrolase I FolE [Sulfoacidibacillus ferrooxidans]MCI0184326.1 GTP cyclohydrolase 1 [Sulfoacidibacillus ferrooxidans]MCY0894271.1 GTP cyclohydrolase I FolE [Acidibacillus sp.]